MSTLAILADLAAALEVPSCGTSVWDAQSSLASAERAAREMRAAGDGRLAAILDRVRRARVREGDAGGRLNGDAKKWAVVERRVLRFIRSRLVPYGIEVCPDGVRPRG